MTTRPGGFRCPLCDGPTAVLKIRHPAPGIVARRRRCLACPHRLTTHERAVREDKGLLVAPGRKNAG